MGYERYGLIKRKHPTGLKSSKILRCHETQNTH